jgi:hypothetical protein
VESSVRHQLTCCPLQRNNHLIALD